MDNISLLIIAFVHRAGSPTTMSILDYVGNATRTDPAYCQIDILALLNTLVANDYLHRRPFKFQAKYGITIEGKDALDEHDPQNPGV